MCEKRFDPANKKSEEEGAEAENKPEQGAKERTGQQLVREVAAPPCHRQVRIPRTDRWRESVRLVKKHLGAKRPGDPADDGGSNRVPQPNGGADRAHRVRGQARQPQQIGRASCREREESEEVTVQCRE